MVFIWRSGRDRSRRRASLLRLALIGAVLTGALTHAQQPASARGMFADLPGVRLWFTDTGGRGEPVVFLHAITGTSESWEPQIEAFVNAGYRVITYDRRGWGKSTANPATGPQPGHASDDLHTLADHLALGRFHLVGVAGGGFVALDYAAWHSDRLRSLVVGASTGSMSERELQDFSARIEIPGIRALSAHYREIGASYRGANPDGTQRWLAIYERAQQPQAPTQPLRSLNTFAKLEMIDVRTLVIAGEADLIAPPGLMRVWAGHVKNALWTTVPDAGHAIAWEKPEIFNRTVLRFLEGDGPFARVTDVPRN